MQEKGNIAARIQQKVVQVSMSIAKKSIWFVSLKDCFQMEAIDCSCL